MEWEFGIFFHFGVRTFYPGHKDWDGNEVEMTPDGFANWPFAYTSYNISKTPWKDGKGDVVADYVAACREYGLKVGLYFSPADANIIGKKLTAEEYDQERIIRVVRTLQPEILIFNMWDPDTRWIGNEEGMAPIRSYNEVEDLDFSVRTDRKDLLEKIILYKKSVWFFIDRKKSQARRGLALVSVCPEGALMYSKKDQQIQFLRDVKFLYSAIFVLLFVNPLF